MHWLAVAQLVMPDADDSTNNGWMRVTRLGKSLAESDPAFEAFRRAQVFPRSLLHPKIADKAWAAMARGELADAVFSAYRTLEERVREVGRYSAEDIGADLMRKAFKPGSGPLTNKSLPLAEQEGLMHVAAGAFMAYKNPHSHRTVTLSEPLEAQEMLMLASHLLRIVDAREARQVESNQTA